MRRELIIINGYVSSLCEKDILTAIKNTQIDDLRFDRDRCCYDYDNASEEVKKRYLNEFISSLVLLWAGKNTKEDGRIKEWRLGWVEKVSLESLEQ
ncbi:hypothetical protein [Arcobacter sp. FWKO B]|uniref:hypothetical protein n=1 Tax=Arcobacter sp. FWKO B TaxID=2593672 RepID=UPI0018A4FC29|nr:hypothetical protein [Arcobacter sp. FWKO B]QOG13048.1 hypothetical protein FWKOB_10260 [Arcobacter sp. FWKO B]